jgi:general stress protein 26
MEKEQGKIKNLERTKAIEKLQELVKHDAVCMFTTNIMEDPLATRPMATQQVDDNGDFWFLSGGSSHKNTEIENDSRVQLYYANTRDSEFLTVFGRATISNDRQKIEEIWNPLAKAWFKEGKNDPELTLIKVKPEEAYYWDTKSNKMVSIMKILASTVSGRSMDDGIEGELKV